MSLAYLIGPCWDSGEGESTVNWFAGKGFSLKIKTAIKSKGKKLENPLH